MGIDFQFYKMKSSGDWLHNNMNVFNTTIEYSLLKIAKMINVMLCLFYYN